MENQLRAGIVGTGFMGQVHARAIRAAGGVVSRIADRTPALAREAVERLHAGLPAASVEELVHCDEVDVVHVCVPNALHAETVQAALSAGKAVICEKPLATNVGDAERLVALAQRTQLMNAVPFVYRYYPTVREARRRISDGDVGTLRLLHGSYLQDWLSGSRSTDWRVEPTVGGASRAFADIGIHWCDLMEFVTGHRIIRLTARLLIVDREVSGLQKDRARTEDAATILFETDRGALGSVVLSQVSPGRKNRLWFSFDGSEESVSFDQESPDGLWVGSLLENRVLLRGTAAMGADAARLSIVPAGHPQGFQDCFNAFVTECYSAVKGQHQDGRPTFVDGLRAAVLTQAVLDSARALDWMEIAPVSPNKTTPERTATLLS